MFTCYQFPLIRLKARINTTVGPRPLAPAEPLSSIKWLRNLLVGRECVESQCWDFINENIYIIKIISKVLYDNSLNKSYKQFILLQNI